MGRPPKKQIKISNDSFLGIAQETYNELVEQRTTAIRQINENKKSVQVEDVHDLVNLNKANTDLLTLIDKTIDKKLSLIKLMSQIIYKNTDNNTQANDGSLTPEDLDLLRNMFQDNNKSKDNSGDNQYKIKD